MTSPRSDAPLLRGLTIAVVLALVVAAALWWTLRDAGEKHLTAYFPSAVGLYEGNGVRVLGVEVGTVDKVEPVGQQVRVELSYDRGVRIPADAQAAIVAPSLVSDRYVQLAPAFTEGKVIEEGATIPRERTAVPLEVDDLAASLSRVSESLGPNGANRNGALSDLLDVVAKNVDGNGQALHDTITRLGQAAGTLSGNKDDLFATVTNLAGFSQTLADSDGQVRRLNEQLADVSGYLAGERQNLAATVTQLGTTLTSVQQFIQANRGRLKSNVDKLASVTQVLVNQRGALAEILDVAPLGLSNLYNSYNASGGTLDARANINELGQPPATLVCNLLGNLADSVSTEVGKTCRGLTSSLGSLPSPGQVIAASNSGQLPALPLPLVDSAGGGGLTGVGK